MEGRLHSPGSLPVIFEKQCGNGTSFLAFHRYRLTIVAHMFLTLSIYLEVPDEALGSNETQYANVYSYTTTRLDRHSGLQNAEAPRMSRKSTHEGGVVSPTQRTPLLPGDIPGIHCL